jgi:hypothetical protein
LPPFFHDKAGHQRSACLTTCVCRWSAQVYTVCQAGALQRRAPRSLGFTPAEAAH